MYVRRYFQLWFIVPRYISSTAWELIFCAFKQNEYQRAPLIVSQHWLGWWFGVARQEALSTFSNPWNCVVLNIFIKTYKLHVDFTPYSDAETPRYIIWWRHQMETFSALLTICAGNSPVPGEFPTQRPLPRSFDVFFDQHPNKRLSKQWWGWWFEMPSCPLWRHRNENAMSQSDWTRSHVIPFFIKP